MIIREYMKEDVEDMIRIWNEVVIEGNAFPHEECLEEATGASFFSSQSYTGVAEDDPFGGHGRFRLADLLFHAFCADAGCDPSDLLDKKKSKRS